MCEKCVQLRRELDELGRWAALGIIVDYQQQRSGWTAPWDVQLEHLLATVPARVAGLVRAFQGHEIGECRNCRHQAPLESGRCAWGCRRVVVPF